MNAYITYASDIYPRKRRLRNSRLKLLASFTNWKRLDRGQTRLGDGSKETLRLIGWHIRNTITGHYGHSLLSQSELVHAGIIVLIKIARIPPDRVTLPALAGLQQYPCAVAHRTCGGTPC